MSRTTKHLVMQVLLLTAWVAIVAIRYTVPVRSQAPSCGIPGSATPTYVHLPPMHSWPALKTGHVKIDQTWNSTERGYFEQGIRKWNGALNCSGVTFDDFSPRQFPDPNESVPDDTIYWIQAEPGWSYNGITHCVFKCCATHTGSKNKD